MLTTEEIFESLKKGKEINKNITEFFKQAPPQKQKQNFI